MFMPSLKGPPLAFLFLPALLISAGSALASSTTLDLLGGLLGTVINALGIGLVAHIDVYIPLARAFGDPFQKVRLEITVHCVRNQRCKSCVTSIDFDEPPSSPFALTITRVSATAGLNTTICAAFTHTFSAPFVLPPLGKANSGIISDVTLTQGAEKTVGIIESERLDSINVDVDVW
ncbi:hypothetical protein MVEN_01575600 [Mycena venus]|uniref:Uncharacterized protein n=1 Tax=Mycena venus TaxID=2733690 RepID=A0A8H6XRT1_9AGAR|nr:hypothetical protein MVEN_01575600 [Mycena venus]